MITETSFETERPLWEAVTLTVILPSLSAVIFPFSSMLATDASENTRKTISDSCLFYNRELIEILDKDTLGHWVGAKAPRAVVTVNDDNFAKAIKDIYLSIEREKG